MSLTSSRKTLPSCERSFLPRWGTIALSNAIQRARTVFTWAQKNGKIDKAPTFGDEFKKPPKRAIRLQRAEKLATRITGVVAGRAAGCSQDCQPADESDDLACSQRKTKSLSVNRRDDWRAVCVSWDWKS